MTMLTDETNKLVRDTTVRRKCVHRLNKDQGRIAVVLSGFSIGQCSGGRSTTVDCCTADRTTLTPTCGGL